MNSEWLNALLGGLLIGLSVSLMLLWNGRVTGISGIVYGLLSREPGERQWRSHFVLGLLTGGLALTFIKADPFPTGPLDWRVPVAGLLVGFGTVLGSGCTSGHGICGVSRLSKRSVIATLTFILAGIAAARLAKGFGL